MGTTLQSRKFKFFEIQSNVDNGTIGGALEDKKLTCTTSTCGSICFGDNEGFVYVLNRQLFISKFQAHSDSISIIHSVDGSNILLTVQTSETGEASELKVWNPERKDPNGLPMCLRTIKPDPRPNQNVSKEIPQISALSLHPNNALLAIGFHQGSIMLLRGDVRRERGSKMRVIVTLGSSPITNLHLKCSAKSCHLFITSNEKIYVMNCSLKDKETTVELDSKSKSKSDSEVGCKPYCSAISDSKHEQELMVARDDAIYTYTTDSKASCYVLEGNKVRLFWFKGYMIVVAKVPENQSQSVLTVYDPCNKIICLSTVIEGFVDVIGEWNGIYVLNSEPSLCHLMEKDLQTKLEILFKKNQFDLAINLAKLQSCNDEEISEIFRKYGDWLYNDGKTVAAMNQYIKTIPHLQPSYVIRKYLETQHIENLTKYLQALHESGNATNEHTTLMLNCYTRLQDDQRLNQFIMKGDSAECNAELSVEVCRSAGYFDHALKLAQKHSRHSLYLDILVTNKKDYAAALQYISELNLETAKDMIEIVGSALLMNIPNETVDFLVSLCTNENNGERANPEEFESLLLGHHESIISNFLEKLMELTVLSEHLNTTLLAELLLQHSQAPEGQDQSIESKILNLLENANLSIDYEHALLLCDKHNFVAGKLMLWERSKMFEELLTWYAARGDFKSLVKICDSNGDSNPTLWCSVLRFMTGESSKFPPDFELLHRVLKKIDERELMPSLEIVELLTSSPHINLGHIRDYLLKVVDRHTLSATNEDDLSDVQRKNTQLIQDNIRSITNETIEFTGAKCNVCNNNLDLPSVHFLCRHSFHVHCFESYAEVDSECPVCYPETKKIRDHFIQQERQETRPDILRDRLDSSKDPFGVMADFMSKSAFTSRSRLKMANPSPMSTYDPHIENRENFFGVKQEKEVEARLRIKEGSNQPIQAISEGRLRQSGSSSPAIQPSEARLRITDRAATKMSKTAEHQPSEGRLRTDTKEARFGITTAKENRFKVTGTPPKSQNSSASNSPLVSSSRKSYNPGSSSIVDSVISTNKTLRDARYLQKSDNPFEDSSGLNPFGDFETEISDSANLYEEKTNNNPFGESSEENSPVRKGLKKVSDSVNPFEDEYDDSLNPFS